MESIGHFSAAIEDADLDHVRQTMREHGVHLQKSNQIPEDNWWFFLLPRGTTRVRKEHRGDVPRYTIRLPDDYCFTLEIGPLNRDGYYSTPPLIFLDTPE